MPRVRPFAALLPALLLLALPPRAVAQGLEKAPTPIEMTLSAPSATPGPAGASGPAKTLTVLPNTPVRISGTSVPVGAGTTVKVSVTPPAGGAVALTATLGADNAWSTTFPGTGTPGTYSVTAQSPDGKNSATATFVVGAAAAVTQAADAVVSAIGSGAPVVDAGIQASTASLANRGEFPGREQVMQNLAQVSANAKEISSKLAGFKTAAKTLADIAARYPGGAAELEPITTAMVETAGKLGEQAALIQAARPAVENTNGVCDRLDAVNEVLSAISLWYDLEGLLFQKIIGVASDKYLGDRVYNAAVPAAQRNNADKFALTESLKSVATILSGGALGGSSGASTNLVEFVTKPKNLLADTTQLLVGMVFDKYCEKFTGPVTGTFKVDATVNGGLRFWGYTAQLDGSIVLMYEKSLVKANQPIPMTGEIEGNAFFKMYEDLMNLNTFNKAFVLKNFLVPPIGMGAAARAAVGPLGKAARLVTPGYYRVPVKARLDPDNTLTITVSEKATNDFSEAVKGRAVYIVMPPASPVPYVMISNIPVQKAQFMLSRGLRWTSTLPVTTKTSGKNMIKVAEKTFDRVEHVSNNEVTVTWSINVKACNPDCP